MKFLSIEKSRILLSFFFLIKYIDKADRDTIFARAD